MKYQPSIWKHNSGLPSSGLPIFGDLIILQFGKCRYSSIIPVIMESEDEDKPLDEYDWGPKLRIFDKDEHELISFYRLALQGESAYDWADPRFYRILRFFRVVEGFYTGNLDLTGRHEPRYVSAMKRWNVYSEDVLELERTLKRDEVKDISDLQPDHPLVMAWDKIQTKWYGKTGLFHLDTVLFNIHSVLEAIKSHPAPFLQRLTLTDLPPEILYEIFLLLPPADARKLTASCHDLKEIGLRVAFRSRAIRLNVDWDNLPKPLDPSAVPGLIKEAGEELKSHVDFLQTRKDLADEMTNMSLKDFWMELVQRADWADEEWFPVYQELLTSYHRLFSQVVATARHLQFLSISFISIDVTLIQHISLLPQLYTLCVFSCTISDDAQTLLHHCQSHPITNLTLSFTQEDHLTMWCLLLICPNLCNLTLISVDFLLEEPPRDIWDKITFFPSLQWLSLSYLWEGSLENLLEWFMNQPPLHSLTRFKYHSQDGTSDQTIFSLIDVLAAAPLEILVLHGFDGSGLEILDRITTQLPDLIGMALHRRHNERQRRDSLADWPHPSAKYAELFSRFTRLRHFRWNFRTPYLDGSPASIVGFEEGFVTEDQKIEERFQKQGPALFFDDAYVLALPFAAYCPTLKTHAVHIGHHAESAIDRSASGAIFVRQTNNEERDLIDEYSPFVWSSWGAVIPGPADRPNPSP
ncbi:hypothetical protein BDN72DRAFT_898106 [Pluteus cervinus]|uniref:Uncharacterized protein n=1 Tax=Pluteus cervinus TaxID=181527 RepID=A0ACD3ARY8_9AGAR|nr:hypothetical protein BDN72DRAFT_898106 [Pluteus cervinus]